MKILTDDVEKNPVLDFERYSEAIAEMVKNSDPKFAVGIYGEWGTGKTTLMKLVEKKLGDYVRGDVITWEKIPKDTYESNNLKSFLIENFQVSWIQNLDILKENKTISITEADATTLKVDSKGSYEIVRTGVNKGRSLSIKLNDERTLATLSSDDNIHHVFRVKKEGEVIRIFLKEENILPVWFNAWKYEREEQFALLALMKTIAYAMTNHPIYKEIKPILLRGLGLIGKDILRNLALRFAMTEKGIDELDKKLLPRLELLSEVDKDTIYFDGLNKIETDMHKIMTKYPKSRIVVFIDDLDRCSPEKVLQVLESIKVFLDIEGFIFIIGLSHETVSKLISNKYGIKGEEYIKKIIQIPVSIQEWNRSEITLLVNEFIERNKLEKTDSEIIRQRKNLIASAIEPNPRELKRFINNFIVSYKIYSSQPQVFTWDDIQGKDEFKFKKFLNQRFRSMQWVESANVKKTDNEITLTDEKFSVRIRRPENNNQRAIMTFDGWTIFEFLAHTKDDKLVISAPQIKAKELLLVQALKEKWKDFYREISLNEQLRKEFRENSNELKDIIKISREDPQKNLADLVAEKAKLSKNVQALLTVYSMDTGFWSFLWDYLDDILKIEDWEIYRRASESVKEIPIPEIGVSLNETALKLLQDSKVMEFNELLKKKAPSTVLNFSGENLSRKHLSGVDLTSSILEGTDFSFTDLSYASINGASIKSSNFSFTDLSHVRISGWNAFTQCNFSYAKLPGLKLIDGYLKDLNFSSADLTNSVFTAADAPFTVLNSDFVSTQLKACKLETIYFNNVNLSSSDLSSSLSHEAHYDNCKLIHTNLSYSYNRTVTFANCDLSYANFSNSLIIDCGIHGAVKCVEADFSNAIINKKEIVDYLRNNNAKNVPDEITDKVEIDKKTKELGLLVGT